jgi:2-dehydropantoate 2-reductase
VVAVLGLGGVGGMLVARSGALGIGTARTVAAIREHGLRLTHYGQTAVTRPVVLERLDRPVDVLIVAVKAHDLEGAFERIPRGVLRDAVVLPLLNGVEQVQRLRDLLGGAGATVIAGSIGLYEGFATEPGWVVQRSDGARVRAASDSLSPQRLAQVLTPLRSVAVEVVVGGTEAEVLWEKAARLSVLAAGTAAARAPLGAILEDPRRREQIRLALTEACSVATVSGAPQDAQEQWALIESLDPDLETSAGRDAAAGRPTELDAITGSVVRAARACGVPVPVLGALLDEALTAGAR